jgi:hypothetical protein
MRSEFFRSSGKRLEELVQTFRITVERFVFQLVHCGLEELLPLPCLEVHHSCHSNSRGESKQSWWSVELRQLLLEQLELQPLLQLH